MEKIYAKIALKHLALIPDGHRRWAKLKGYSREKGHRIGFYNIHRLLLKIELFDIKVLSVWAFSPENWKRTKGEVQELMQIYTELIDIFQATCIEKQVKFLHIGRKDRIPTELKKKILNLENITKNFNRFFFALGIDYGGQDEIIRAVQLDLLESKKQLSFKTIESHLDTAPLPYPSPDLIVRTGGEQRLSGYMLWYSAYSELIFVRKKFPDFNYLDLLKCIEKYNERQRRFGR